MGDQPTILPPCEPTDEQGLLAWLRACEQTGARTAEHIRGSVTRIHDTLYGYARAKGLDHDKAVKVVRLVTEPITRAASEMENFAGELQHAVVVLKTQTDLGEDEQPLSAGPAQPAPSAQLGEDVTVAAAKRVGGGDSFIDKIADALHGADALTAAPVRIVRDHDRGTITLAGVPDPEAPNLLRGVLSYVMASDGNVNALLRGGKAIGSRSRAEAFIETIDTALRHSPLTHDVLVFRGIQDGRSVFGDAWRGDLTGCQFREPGYSSTSADRRRVEDFISDRDIAPAELRIHVPAGTHAINLSDFGDAHGDEAELLLDRDLPFRVVADRSDHGRRYLDVEITP
jgi:hypothetical protein